MCGSHHVAAGGGKLHELGAWILALEAGDVASFSLDPLIFSFIFSLPSSLFSSHTETEFTRQVTPSTKNGHAP